MDTTHKPCTITVDNRPLWSCSRKPSVLSSITLDESSDGYTKLVRHYDSYNSDKKIQRGTFIEIEIPSIIVHDKHSDIEFLIKRDFINTIIRNFVLGYEINNTKVVRQSACDDFYSRYIIGKEDLVTYSINPKMVVGKWYRMTPSFNIVVKLPFFYSEEGGSFRPYMSDHKLYHDIRYNLDVVNIISVRRCVEDEVLYITELIDELIYFEKRVINIPRATTDFIYISQEEEEYQRSNPLAHVFDNYVQLYNEVYNSSYGDNITVDLAANNITALYISAENLYAKSQGFDSCFCNDGTNIISAVTLVYSDNSQTTLNSTMIRHMFSNDNSGILKINFNLYSKIKMSDITESNLVNIVLSINTNSLSESMFKSYSTYTDKLRLNATKRISDDNREIESKGPIRKSECKRVDEMNVNNMSIFYDRIESMYDVLGYDSEYNIVVIAEVRKYL